METDMGEKSPAIKRIKLDLDWPEERTVSSDSGTVEDMVEGRLRRTLEGDGERFDPWWRHSQFKERIRRISSESNLSVDSISKEFISREPKPT